MAFLNVKLSTALFEVPFKFVPFKLTGGLYLKELLFAVDVVRFDFRS